MIPRTAPAKLKCPRYLDKIARREWKRIVGELDRIGLLREGDQATLEAFCSTYSAMVQAQTVIAELGQTYTTSTGYYRLRPEVEIAFRSASTLRALAVELGLTPAARVRMAVPTEDEVEGEMDRFLRGL